MGDENTDKLGRAGCCFSFSPRLPALPFRFRVASSQRQMLHHDDWRAAEFAGLLRAGREPPAWIGGVPALVYLAREGHEGLALRACRAHASVHVCDANGMSPLHYAAAHGLQRLLNRLLDQGLDACQRSEDTMQCERLDENPDTRSHSLPRIKAAGGRCALHFAAAAGHEHCVETLVRHDGSAALLRDWVGLTPAQLASMHGHASVCQTLLACAERLGETDAASMVPLSPRLRSGYAEMESSGVHVRSKRRLDITCRPLLHAPFTLRSFWTALQSEAFILAAEQRAKRHGWQTSRHPYHSTVDLAASDIGMQAYAHARASIDRVVLPAMQMAYETRPLTVREMFVARYSTADGGSEEGRPGSEGPRQVGLGFHKDGTILNAIVLLSEPGRDFKGGGTVFGPPLDRVYHTQQGDCLCSSGQLVHGGADITSGSRYVLVAFIDEQQSERDGAIPCCAAHGRAAAEAAAARLGDDAAAGSEDSEGDLMICDWHAHARGTRNSHAY